jgi:hypothetical protein
LPETQTEDSLLYDDFEYKSMQKQLGYILTFISGLVILMNTSCQKDKTSIDYFLTNGTWQLANLQEYTYIGSTLQKTDTINKKCQLLQLITFNTNQSVNYSGNFQCNTQTAAGKWSLFQKDTIRLQSDLLLKDSLNQNIQPFKDSRVLNLGQYSLVIETGDISPVYTSRQVRKILRYSFVH